MYQLSRRLLPGRGNKGSVYLSMNTLMSILRHLSFYLAYKKLHPPAQRCRFLGIELDSLQLQARLPRDKIQKLKSELDFFKDKKRATLHQLQRLTGILCHASKVIYGARPFTHRIIQMLKLFNSCVRRIRISDEFRSDVQWWRCCATTFNGATAILSSRTTIVDPIVPIVSEDGFRVSFANTHVLGQFVAADTGYSIDTCATSHMKSCAVQVDYRYDMAALRLLSILCAALCYCNVWKCNNVFLLSKSRSLVRSLRKGCANSNLESVILRDLFWLSVYYDFRLIPFYI